MFRGHAQSKFHTRNWFMSKLQKESSYFCGIVHPTWRYIFVVLKCLYSHWPNVSKVSIFVRGKNLISELVIFVCTIYFFTMIFQNSKYHFVCITGMLIQSCVWSRKVCRTWSRHHHHRCLYLNLKRKSNHDI